MTVTRSLAVLIAAASLAACSMPDRAMRAAPLSGADLVAVPLAETGPGAATLRPAYTLRSVTVDVPQSLVVSEANSFFPNADIVWRGEPRGDRRAQVAAIVSEAFGQAAALADGGTEADAEITVTRFHGVTERTRYTVGGIHAVRLTLTLRDAATGAVIDGPRPLAIDIPASGGQRAIDEESRGLTQRVVVVHNLAHAALRALAAEPAPVSRLEGDLVNTLAAVSMKNEIARPGTPAP